MNGHEMVNCSTWWDGPKYLQPSECEWPNDQSATETRYDAMLGVVKNPLEVTHVLAASEGKPASINLTEIIKCEEFGTRDSLLRVTAYVMRFINNVRRKVKHKVNKRKQNEIQEVCEQLCADEINHAETYWIRTIQANSFSSEIQFLRNGNQSKPRLVEQFTLFLDKKQMLRCRGRINNSSLPQTSKNPILLPSSHPYVDLLIRHTHERVKHSAVTNKSYYTPRKLLDFEGMSSREACIKALCDMLKT